MPQNASQIDNKKKTIKKKETDVRSRQLETKQNRIKKSGTKASPNKWIELLFRRYYLRSTVFFILSLKRVQTTTLDQISLYNCISSLLEANA